MLRPLAFALLQAHCPPTPGNPFVLHAGPPAQIAELPAEHFSHGAERVVISVAAGNWFRQAELAAEARNLLKQPV